MLRSEPVAAARPAQPVRAWLGRAFAGLRKALGWRIRWGQAQLRYFRAKAASRQHFDVAAYLRGDALPTFPDTRSAQLAIHVHSGHGPEAALACLRAIAAHPPGVSYRVGISGFRDDETTVLRQLTGVTIGPVPDAQLQLSIDVRCLPTAGALDALIRTMAEYPSLSFVTPLPVSPDGEVIDGGDARASRHAYVRRVVRASGPVVLRRVQPGDEPGHGVIAVPDGWGLLQPEAVFVATGAVSVAMPASEQGVTLIVEQSIPEPDRSAGHRNIHDFIRTLVAAGQSVKFWAMDGMGGTAYARALQQMGVEVVSSALQPSLPGWLRHNRSSIGRVMICRPHVAERYLDAIRAACDAPVLYYGHDLHCARMGQQADLTGDRRQREAAEAMERLEQSIWRRADISLYPTQVEVEAIRSRCPDARVLPVQIFCFDEFPRRQVAPAGAEILFVGNFGHAPNVDAVSWFAQTVFPLVLAARPDARLVIAGSAPPAAICALADAAIAVPGWLSDAALTEAYDAARAAGVPLRFGSGLKLKVVEALRHGVPLVTTPVGAQGLVGLETVAKIAERPEAIAAETLALLGMDDADWLARANRQVAYAENQFGRASMLASLQTAFAAADAVRR